MSYFELISQLFLALLCLSNAAVVFSSPFSSLAVARSSADAVVCALLPSPAAYSYELNCTSIRRRVQWSYGSSGDVAFAAVAAGNDFLCVLTASSSDGYCSMRWWGFPRANGSVPYEKRIYWGPAVSALAAGDAHVCALISGVNQLECWRWSELDIHTGFNFSEIAVGRDFLCGRENGGGAIRCIGNDTAVVGKEPPGSFGMVAAGSWHVCGASDGGQMTCWGTGAPELDPAPLDVASMALGDNTTCVLRSNGEVLCWGEASRPPEYLAGEQFISIQARGDAICGIMTINYSVVCWGNELFQGNHTVYGKVMPGTCSPAASCRCGVLPDSGILCAANHGICQSCMLQLSSNFSNNSSSSPQANGGEKRLLLLVLGSLVFGLGLVALLSLLVYLSRQQSNRRVYNALCLGRWRRSPVHRVDSWSGSGTVEEFSLQFLLEVTDSFSEAHKIGSGSFGAVFRATLPSGHQVAIKRADVLPAAATASAPSSSSRRHAQLLRRNEQQRERAFWSELALLSRVNHKNLVRLLGFCRERGERVLVYEYMANGTLHDQLHRRPVAPPSPLSSWAPRLRIALDAARGVEYLHTYAVPAIIHRDIKSSNILLDEEWTAKVADFGVSLTSLDEEGSVAAGTVGYMDPEYYRLRRLTEKSDVYSFGVVLLEIVTGYKAIHRSQLGVEGGEEEEGEAEEEEEEVEGSATPRNVVEMAVPWIEADEVARVMDRRVAPASAVEAEAVAYVGYVAAECVRAEGRERPTMAEVVGALERAVEACAGTRAEPTERRRALSRAQSLL